MNVQTVTSSTDGTLSGDIVDPTQSLLSGMVAMQQQLTDGLSGLNVKLDETKTLIEDNMKVKAPVTPKKTGT
jgi:hypothetical protein